MSYKVAYSKAAVSQIPYLKAAQLDKKVKNLIELIKMNPF